MKSVCNPTSKSNRIVGALTVLALSSACTSINGLMDKSVADKPAESAQLQPAYQDRIQRHIYAGVGLGKSWMQPDADAIPQLTVNERVDTSTQLTLGVDLSRQVSVEGHAASLGSAGFSPAGEVSYNNFGASALYYVGKNRHNYKRHGFSGFARLGVGMLDNKATDNVPIEQLNSVHLLLGAGLEYMTRSGLGLRLEGVSLDDDVRFAQLGLIYRIGQRDEQKPIETVMAPEPEPVLAPEPVAPTPVVPPVAAVAVAPTKINACNFKGESSDLNFHSGSAELTDEAIVKLQAYADDLIQCETKSIRIGAHTDSVGKKAYNQGLSERRADSVADFLTDHGVAVERIKAHGFGETQPLDTNSTPAGRRNNRRVELYVDDFAD